MRRPGPRPKAVRPSRARRPRRRGAARALLVSFLVLVVLAAAGAVVQLLRAVPPAQASFVLPAKMTVPGPAPTMPWPSQAAAAVDIEGVGSLGGVRAEQVRPLASVTKLLTALVVLKDHPLGPGQQGPTVTVSAAEAATYPEDLALDQSVVKVVAGEQLSERQALEAMLVPSADNMAEILARWCSGSVPSFVRALNAEAASLGLAHTHLADPSGYNSRSVGTAADMVRVGELVMTVPVLRQIVGMAQVTLPVAGTVSNYDTVLGQAGIIGIKTGSDSEAGGNFVFAARKQLYGRPFTVVGAVLGGGGPKPLQSALDDAKQLASAAFDQVKKVTVLPAGRAVVNVKTDWGASDTGTTATAISFYAVPGETVTLQLSPSPAVHNGRLATVRAGEMLATVRAQAGSQTASAKVAAAAALPGAPVSYKLFRS